MTPEVSLILALIIAGFAILIFFLNKKLSELSEKNKPDETLTEWLKSMQVSIDNTAKTLNSDLSFTSKNLSDTLQKGNHDLNTRLDNAARLMAQIQRDAGKFAELSASMKNLQDYLRSPKLRGNIGEEVLKDLSFKSVSHMDEVIGIALKRPLKLRQMGSSVGHLQAILHA